LAIIPSTLAAVNDTCANGIKGICIDSDICGSYGGTTSTGNCPNDPNNIKCCSNIPCKADGMTGSCMFENECDGIVYSGLCPGGSNFKCCIKKTQTTGVGSVCSDQGVNGICIDTNDSDCNSILVSGICPGEANIQCCLNLNIRKPIKPFPTASGVGRPCSDQGISGTCINTNIDECSTTLVPGKCAGAANIQCCLNNIKKPITTASGVGRPCSDQGISGTCINTNIDECSTTLAPGKCAGAANIQCCLNSIKKPIIPIPTASGVGKPCSDQGISGTCINTNIDECSTTLVPGKCAGAANIRCCLDNN